MSFRAKAMCVLTEKRAPPVRGRPREKRAAYFEAVTSLPPLALQSALEASTQPLPLQLFCDLQELSAPAQAPLPLQELMPEQWTVAFVAVESASALPAEKRLATAPARMAPCRERMVMWLLLRLAGLGWCGV